MSENPIYDSEPLTEKDEEQQEDLAIQKTDYKDLNSIEKLDLQRDMAISVSSFFHIITTFDTGTIYFYEKGVYRPDAKRRIQALISYLLDKTQSTSCVIEVLQKVEAMTMKERTIFTTDPDEICVENGILNTKTRTLEPHTHLKYHIRKFPINYDKDATCPAIDKFINEIAASAYQQEENAKITQLYEIAGWLLTKGYYPQRAIALIGGGSNGKSSYLNLLKAFIGDTNFASQTLQSLEDDKFAVAELYGKIANLCSDLPSNAQAATGTFKQLTGEDTINGNMKFKQTPIQFKNEAKLIFSANEMPLTSDDTKAFWRRWLFLKFEAEFPEAATKTDPKMINKLVTPQELSGFLNKALDGLDQLREQKQFTATPTIEETREIHRSVSNPIIGFIEEMLEIATEDDFISRKEMHSLYTLYCAHHNLMILRGSITTQVKFTQDFKKLIRKEEYGFTWIKDDSQRSITEGELTTTERGYRCVKKKKTEEKHIEELEEEDMEEEEQKLTGREL